MDKKKPIKNDDTTINFRIPKELKAKIEKKAEEKNLTTSSYVRDLLESVHNGNYCYKKEKRSKRESFLFSKEFLQLIIWIYKKRTNKELETEKYQLNTYISTLKKIDNHLPEHLVEEFDKVLKDVLLVKADDSYLPRTSFEFPNSVYEHKKFNYELIENFLFNEEAFESFIVNGEDSDYEIHLFGGIEM